MVAPLIPFAIGGLTELERQREITDRVAGDAVDLVSKQVLGVEIPSEQNLIKNQNAIRDQYEAQYGSEAATVLDAYGIFESGDEKMVAKKFESFLGATSVDKFVNNAKNISTSDPKLYNQLISQSFIQKRQLKLEDRKDRVNKIFNDRPNIKDFLIEPEKKRTGLAGALIGDRLTQTDLPIATQRLMDQTQAEDVKQEDFVSLLSIRDQLGIVPGAPGTVLKVSEAVSIINSARATYKQNNIYKNVYDTAEFRKEYNDYKRTPEGKKDKRTINDYAFDTYYLPQEIKKVQQLTGMSQQQQPVTQQQRPTELPESQPPKGFSVTPSMEGMTQSGEPLVVQQARDAIASIRSSNVPDADQRIESIKQELRQQLNITNLSDYNL